MPVSYFCRFIFRLLRMNLFFICISRSLRFFFARVLEVTLRAQDPQVARLVDLAPEAHDGLLDRLAVLHDDLDVRRVLLHRQGHCATRTDKTVRASAVGMRGWHAARGLRYMHPLVARAWSSGRGGAFTRPCRADGPPSLAGATESKQTPARGHGVRKVRCGRLGPRGHGAPRSARGRTARSGEEAAHRRRQVLSDDWSATGEACAPTRPAPFRVLRVGWWSAVSKSRASCALADACHDARGARGLRGARSAGARSRGFGRRRLVSQAAVTASACRRARVRARPRRSRTLSAPPRGRIPTAPSPPRTSAPWRPIRCCAARRLAPAISSSSLSRCC